MNVTLSRPSVMDAKVVADKGAGPDDLMVVKPRRYSKSQRKVTLFPFLVTLDAEEAKAAFGPALADGVADRGYVVLDTKTGKLSIEHRVEEVPITLGQPAAKKEPKK